MSNINHHVIIPANPNHLNILVLITKSTIKISIVVILPSKIALRLLSCAVSTADNQDLPHLSSSFNLSNIRTFASIPIPRERIITMLIFAHTSLITTLRSRSMIQQQQQ